MVSFLFHKAHYIWFRLLTKSLLFVKQKDQSEHKVAVLKMALEIRKAVNETGGYVYLGLEM